MSSLEVGELRAVNTRKNGGGNRTLGLNNPRRVINYSSVTSYRYSIDNVELVLTLIFFVFPTEFPENRVYFDANQPS